MSEGIGRSSREFRLTGVDGIPIPKHLRRLRSANEHDATAYDLVLTSETIYRTESLDALVGIMRAACLAGAQAASAGSQSNGAGSSSTDPAAGSSSVPAREISLSGKPLCLVAAKVLYFGVGGGVPDFVRAVEDGDLGHVETVLERTKGVGRKVLRVDWN